MMLSEMICELIKALAEHGDRKIVQPYGDTFATIDTVELIKLHPDYAQTDKPAGYIQFTTQDI